MSVPQPQTSPNKSHISSKPTPASQSTRSVSPTMKPTSQTPYDSVADLTPKASEPHPVDLGYAQESEYPAGGVAGTGSVVHTQYAMNLAPRSTPSPSADQSTEPQQESMRDEIESQLAALKAGTGRSPV